MKNENLINNLKTSLVFVTFILLFCGFALAEQTVKTINMPLGYDAVVNANQIKQYNLSVDYPDGINRVLAMEILVQGDFLAATDLYGGFLAGGTPVFCEPDKWTVFRDADNYEASFDCTPLLQNANWKGGDLTFVVMPTKVAGNLKPRVQLTYENKPTVGIEVYGTEYFAGQNGKTFIQLLDENHQPVNDSSCFTSIYYPNGDVWKFQQLMVYLNEGIYEYDFIVPFQSGVYPISAFCTLPSLTITEKLATDGFESGNGAGGTGWDGSWTLDGCTITTTPPANSGTYFMECFNDREPERTIASNSTYSNLNYDLYWRADSLEGAERVFVYFEDASGVDYLVYTINNGQDDGTWNRLTGSLHEEINGFDFDGDIRFYLSSPGNLENDDFYDIDDLNITLQGDIETNGSEYQIVRGSGEIHVTSNNGEYITELLYGEITNKSFDEDFTFHYDVVSQTSVNKTGQDVSLQLWKPFPCAHIINVSERLPNGTVIALPYSSDVDEIGRCVVKAEVDLNVGQTHDIEILTENYWKRQYGRYKSQMALSTEMINISCQNYVQANNLTAFPIPLTTVPYGQDNMWLACSSYLDLEYHLQASYAQFDPFLNLNFNFSLEQMEGLETAWIHMEEKIFELQDISNIIFNGLNLGNSYSLGLVTDPYPPTNPLYATYFGSISTSYLTYVSILGLPTTVWNYEPRNASIDTTNISVEVNATQIANEVWNSNQTAGITHIGGTTYSIGDDGKIRIRIVKGDDLQENADCTVTIMYPNETKYIDDVAMDNFGEGIYTYDFTTVGPYGVHTYYTDCTEDGGGDDKIFGLNTFQVKDVVSNLTASEIWEYEPRNVSVSINNTEISENVWNYSSRKLTDYSENSIAQGVWEYNNRNLTEFNFLVDTGLVNLTSKDVWEYEPRNVTVEINTTEISEDVWNYSDRELTAWDFLTSENIAAYVWNFTTRLLTGFNFTVNTTDNNLSAKDVWEYANRNLTYTQPMTIDYETVSEYVWNNSDRQLSEFNFVVNTTNNNLTAQEIWEYVNRSLTEFDFTIETGLNNLSAEEVWQYQNRNLTYTEDATNYTLINLEVWNADNRSLTEFNFVIDTGLVNLTAQDIWDNNLQRNLTYYPDSPDATNYSRIVEDVWNISDGEGRYVNGIVIP